MRGGGKRLESGTEYKAPCNDREERMVEIWQDLLGKERIGVRDDFFELGGHSLKAMRMVGLIQREFKVRIGIRDLFTYPTVERIVEVIRAGQWLAETPVNSLTDNSNVIEI